MRPLAAARGRRTRGEFLRQLAPLGIGLVAIVVGTAAGWDRALNQFLVSPPPFIRVVLGVAAALLGLVLIGRSADRTSGSVGPADMVRSIRIVFLAVAAFSAAAGWFLASPLPIVAALIIAGVDILETSFLLLVTAVRGDPGRS